MPFLLKRPAFPHIFQVYVFLIKTMNVFLECWIINVINIQLSATDLLALASMKNAAKCDK